MRILFWGNEDILASDEKTIYGRNGAHCEAQQTLYLAKAFQSIGYNIVISNPVRRIEQLKELNVDTVFLNNYNNLQYMCAMFGTKKVVDKTFALMHRGDCDAINRQWLKEYTDLVGFTCKEATDIWREQIGGPCFTQGFGFPDSWNTPPTQQNPYKPNSKNIVHLGTVSCEDSYKLIRRLAKESPSVYFHIISSFIVTGANEIYLQGIPEPELKHFLFPEENIILHGPIRYGTYTHYLYYADLGLSFSFDKQTAVRAKMWDYLAMGLPVISALENSPEGFLIRDTECGLFANDHNEYADAVKKGLETTFPRDKAIKYMRENESYIQVAKRWDTEIKKLWPSI
jgi:hypothetical protein